VNRAGVHYVYALCTVEGVWRITCSCGWEDTDLYNRVLKIRWRHHMQDVSSHPSRRQ
jgi:hypothetical protein